MLYYHSCTNKWAYCFLLSLYPSVWYSWSEAEILGLKLEQNKCEQHQLKSRLARWLKDKQDILNFLCCSIRNCCCWNSKKMFHENKEVTNLLTLKSWTGNICWGQIWTLEELKSVCGETNQVSHFFVCF